MAYKSFLLGAITLAICCLAVDASTECKMFNLFGDEKNAVENYIDKNLINRCPMLALGEKKYCCYNMNREAYCCDESEYIVNLGIMLMIVIVVFMLLSSIVSFICCICCPCCFCYKKRRGRVSQPQQAVLNPTTHATTSRNQYPNDYQPITKSHIPPGAYPVFPPQPPVPKTYPRGSQL